MYIIRKQPGEQHKKSDSKVSQEPLPEVISDPDRPYCDTEVLPPTQLTNSAVKSRVEPLPTAVINERTLLFRMDSRTLWTKYALGLVNYAVSDVADLSTTPSVERRLTKSATLIGDYFIPYYGIRAGSDIGHLLTDIFNTGVELVAVMKSDGDIVPLKEQWDKQTTEITELFNELNPNQYPKKLLKEMFDALTRLWTDNIKARITEDVILNAESIDGINKLVITGIANHVNKGYQSLADVLSRGVISQYPLLFID